ncbi:MAG: lysophospholipid acyltransferase family protein [Alphaproteobacteria bacterium]
MTGVPLRLRLSRALETAAAYLFYGLCALLPLETASSFGGWLARKVFKRSRPTRTALANLALAFPDKTDAERRAIVDGMWDNLGRVAAEYPHLHKITPLIELVGREHLDAVRASGQGAIFFGGHIGNWEIGPLASRLAGMPLQVVYRRPNNPGVDGLLRHARGKGADGSIPKGHDGARAILKQLKSGGSVGMLVDQKLNEGLAIPFFGQPAMTAPAIALFAHLRGYALHPIRIERLRGTQFRVTIHPALPVDRQAEKAAEVERVMTAVNRLLEGWIRERPEQWLWIHRRWPRST